MKENDHEYSLDENEAEQHLTSLVDLEWASVELLEGWKFKDML